MKVLFAILGLVLVVSHAVLADQELANKLKPYEAFSPYKWTQWIAMRPSKTPVAAAAVAYAPQPDAYPYSVPNDSDDSTEADDDDDDDDDFDTMERTSAFASWFKRAILPQPPPVPETKKPKAEKKAKVATTKKPSIVELPLDFWGPPPSVAPNVTLPPPPGYYAAKKSMFISKLFAALAASVLNATVAPPTAAPKETTTVVPTTISPRQAILDEISELLLTDVARSVPAYPEDTTTEPEEFDDSDEDSGSDEAPTAPARKVKPTTVNPFLLSQIDFLAKLTEAIAATQAKPTAPTTTTPKPKPTTTEAPKGKKGAKATKKSSKKLAKTPAYLKWIPTTTTPSPTEAPPAVPEIDYAALAKALLGNAA